MIPKAIAGIGSDELARLFKSAGGAVMRFASQREEEAVRQFAARKPVGSALDMYNWGHLQGRVETHHLYSKLREFADEEIKRRKKEGIDK